MRVITDFEIDFPTPSGNRYARMHWAAKRRLKKAFILHSRIGASGARRCPAGEHRCVTIERHGSRLLDPDNLAWGAKPLLDALVVVDLLEDDSPKHATVVYAQKKSTRKDEHMRILVEVVK